MNTTSTNNIDTLIAASHQLSISEVVIIMHGINSNRKNHSFLNNDFTISPDTVSNNLFPTFDRLKSTVLHIFNHHSIQFLGDNNSSEMVKWFGKVALLEDEKKAILQFTPQIVPLLPQLAITLQQLLEYIRVSSGKQVISPPISPPPKTPIAVKRQSSPPSIQQAGNKMLLTTGTKTRHSADYVAMQSKKIRQLTKSIAELNIQNTFLQEKNALLSDAVTAMKSKSTVKPSHSTSQPSTLTSALNPKRLLSLFKK